MQCRARQERTDRQQLNSGDCIEWNVEGRLRGTERGKSWMTRKANVGQSALPDRVRFIKSGTEEYRYKYGG